MKLDEIAERYADTLFAQRVEEIHKQHEVEMREVLADLNRRNLLNSGMATSAKANKKLKLVRALAEASVQSYMDAYEKSGTPLEEADVEPLLATVSGQVGLNISNLADDSELQRLRGHLENEGQSIIAETRRRLRIHLDAVTLEGRQKARYLSAALHNLFEAEHERLEQRLNQIAPGLAQQIREAAEQLEKRSSESLSHCALTCRRVLKAFADAVYPPRLDRPS